MEQGFDAPERLTERKAELNHLASEVKRISKNREMNYSEYKTTFEGLTHLRHDNFASCLALRKGIGDKEKTFRVTLTPMLKDEVEPEFMKSELFDKTPDLYWFDEDQLVFCDVAVSRNVSGTKQNKYEKYIPCVQLINIKISKHFKKFRSCLFKTAIVDHDLGNWYSLLSTMGNEVDAKFDEAMYEMAVQCNNNIEDLDKNLFKMTQADHQKAIEYREHKEPPPASPFHDIEIDEELLDAVAENEGFLPKLEENDMLVEDVNEIPKMVLGKLIKGFRKFETGIKPVRKEDMQKVFEKLEDDFSDPEKYNIKRIDKLAPTMHFIYKKKMKNQKLKETLTQWKQDLGKIVIEDVHDAALELITRKLTAIDETVFFHEGPLENWDELKKQCTDVIEPKVFRKSSAKSEIRELFKEAGVGMKGKMKQRGLEKMSAIDLKDKDMVEKCMKYCKEMGEILHEPSVIKHKPIYTDDMNLNVNNEDICSRVVFEYANHIKNVASNTIFKTPTTSKGIYVINTGHPDLIILMLPGGDITHKQGDVRFIQIIRQLKSEHSAMGTKRIVARDLIQKSKSKPSSKYVYHFTRWLSLNLARWEHLKSVCPIPFMSLMKNRSADQMTDERVGEMMFSFMYAACGCQSKISGLIDNFRYMIPGALGEMSGLQQFVEEKMKIPLKSKGQVFFYVKLKEALMTYLGTRHERKLADLTILDDDLSSESLGMEVTMLSPFSGIKWKTREHAYAELYCVFHLTAKGLHGSHQRDTKFTWGVMGGEKDFIEKICSVYSDEEIRKGLPLERADEIWAMDRGGLFCNETMHYSGDVTQRQITIDRHRFHKLLKKENMTGSMLTVPTLTSTNSSVVDIDKDGNVKTQTVLETTLSAVESNTPDAMKMTIEVKDKLLEFYDMAFKEVIVQDVGSYNTPEEMLQKFRMHDPMTMKIVGDFLDINTKRNYRANDEVLSDRFAMMQRNLNIYLRDHEMRNLSEEEKSKFILERVYASLKKKISRISSISVGFNNHQLIDEAEFNAVWMRFSQLMEDEGFNVFAKAHAINELTKKAESTYLKNLRGDCAVFSAFRHYSRHPLHKMVPKKQRTMDDREIFVQDITRHGDYVIEHSFLPVCKMLTGEAISYPGDEKMNKNKRLYTMAQKWVNEKTTMKTLDGDTIPMKRKMFYITGDMTKWSNYDTPDRLLMFAFTMREAFDESHYKILEYLLRKGNKKRVVAPQGMNLAEDDPIHKLFKDCGSTFPTMTMRQNWLQGMRNYISSASHDATMKLIKSIFNACDSKLLYFDSIVHSDDFVIAYGWSEPTLAAQATYSPKRDFLGCKIHWEEIGEFMLKSIVMVLKLNNHHVSIKKTSIDKDFVEFVSFMVFRGNSYMGGEKQLTSIFSEKTNKGPKEDCISTISQANSAIEKGIKSATAQLFLEFGLRDTREDWSMAERMKLDPCVLFGVPPELLPLGLIPEMHIVTPLMTYLSKPEMHDYILMQRLRLTLEDERAVGNLIKLVNDIRYRKCLLLRKEIMSVNLGAVSHTIAEGHRIMAENNMPPIGKKEIEKAAKLAYTMSGQHLGFKSKYVSDEMTSKLEIIPGIEILEDIRQLDKVLERKKHNDCFNKPVTALIKLCDLTLQIVPPKDYFFAMISAHAKIFNVDALMSKLPKNKIIVARMKAGKKNNEVAKLNHHTTYTTMKGVLEEIETVKEKLSRDGALEGVNKAIEIYERRGATITSIMRWMSTISFRKVTAMEKIETSELRSLPSLTKNDLTSNSIKNVLVHILGAERYNLNDLKDKISSEMESDIMVVDQLLLKEGFYDTKDVLIKADIVNNVAKVLTEAGMRRKMLMRPFRGRNELRNVILHLFRTHIIEGADVEIIGEGLEIELPINTQVEDICEVEIRGILRKMMWTTSFFLASGIAVAALRYKGKPFSEMLVTLKSKKTFMRAEERMAFAHLLYEHTWDQTLLKKEAYKNWRIKYMDEGRYYKDSPLREKTVLMIKGSTIVKLEFDGDSVLTVTSEYTNSIIQAIEVYAKRSARYYRFDNYRMPSTVYPTEYVLVGSQGNYDVVKYSEHTNKSLIKGKIIMNEVIFDTKEEGKIARSDNMMEIKYNGAMISNMLSYEKPGDLVGIDFDNEMMTRVVLDLNLCNEFGILRTYMRGHNFETEVSLEALINEEVVRGIVLSEMKKDPGYGLSGIKRLVGIYNHLIPKGIEGVTILNRTEGGMAVSLKSEYFLDEEVEEIPCSKMNNDDYNALLREIEEFEDDTEGSTIGTESGTGSGSSGSVKTVSVRADDDEEPAREAKVIIMRRKDFKEGSKKPPNMDDLIEEIVLNSTGFLRNEVSEKMLMYLVQRVILVCGALEERTVKNISPLRWVVNKTIEILLRQRLIISEEEEGEIYEEMLNRYADIADIIKGHPIHKFSLLLLETLKTEGMIIRERAMARNQTAAARRRDD